jgi:hypothetical protein
MGGMNTVEQSNNINEYREQSNEMNKYGKAE